MRRLNYKLFLILFSVLVVLTGAVFLIHWLQTGSIARALLARAERAEKDDPPQAARYLSRYLELQPDDNEQRARLGRILASEALAVSPKARTRAVFVLEEALRREPALHDLRFKLVRLALDLNRPDLARDHLDELEKTLKEDGQVEYLRGQLAELQQKPGEAISWYEQARTHAPQRIDSYIRLADLLHQADKGGKNDKRADGVMDDLVKNNAQDYRALLARWQYRKQRLGLEKACEPATAADVAEALRVAPTVAEVLLAGAELEQRLGRPEKARALLQKGREEHRTDGRMYRELALLELRQERNAKRREAALACLRDGAKNVSAAGKSDLLWTLANVLLDGDEGKVSDEERAEAERVIAQMARAGGAPVSLDYLNARVCMHRNNYAEAARLLERRVRPQLDAAPELRSRVDLYLAQCYEQLNDPAAQVATWTRLKKSDASALAPRLGLAAALQAQGRLDEALGEYQELTRFDAAPVSCWIETVRLLVLREALRTQQARGNGPRPKADPRAAKEIDAVLAAAEARNEKAVQKPEEKTRNGVALTLLRAELLMGRGEAAKAEELLTTAREKQPEQIELWAALASLAIFPDGGNDRDRGLRILDEAEAQAGTTPERWLAVQQARIRFWMAWGQLPGEADAVEARKTEAVSALKTLAQKWEKRQTKEPRLLADLAQAHVRLGNSGDAEQLWSALAEMKEYENDLTLRLLLYDLALQAGKEDVMARRLADVKRIEGADGVFWRYGEAARLVWRARQGKTDGLEQARVLLDNVTAKRPNWSAAAVARGDLEEIKGNLTEAVASYQKALTLGERNPRVLRQLVELLYKQQRFDDARPIIEKFQEMVFDSTEAAYLQRLQTNMALRSQDFTEAKRLIEKSPASSKDYRDYLWQGQVLAAAGDLDQADARLRKAVELGETVPETWVAWVQVLARKDRDRAAKEVERARTKLPADKAPLALAQCYEAVGNLTEAEAQYRDALKAKPGDAQALRSAAGFFLRTNQPSVAETHLRTLMGQPAVADAAWARRTLAIALAGSGDYGRYPEALALVGLKLESPGHVVEGTAPQSDDLTEERRTQAQVLAVPMLRETRRKAIALLEDLNNRRALSAADQYLLGQLYDADGNAAKAREFYRLVASSGKNPMFVANYALFLLRQREWNEAAAYITRLEELEKERKVTPGDFGSAELKAQRLEGTRQGKQAVEVLTKYVEQKTTRPDKVIVLVALLTRQQQFDEALAWCRKARATLRPEAIGGATVAVLRAAKADRERCAEVEAWLQEELKKDPKSVLLPLHLADLCDVYGDYKSAEDWTRKASVQGPDNVTVLNNLAWRLAQNGKAAEGLVVINKAITLVGPRAELLDTRSTVHVKMGRADLAIADLEAALADGAVPPARYGRLAEAQLLANNVKAATELLRKADGAGLKQQPLHPLEQAAFNKLRDELLKQR